MYCCYVMCFEHIRRRIRGACDHCLYGSESIAELLLLQMYDSVFCVLIYLSSLQYHKITGYHFLTAEQVVRYVPRIQTKQQNQRVIKIIAQYLVPQMNFEG